MTLYSLFHFQQTLIVASLKKDVCTFKDAIVIDKESHLLIAALNYELFQTMRFHSPTKRSVVCFVMLYIPSHVLKDIIGIK